MAPFASAPHCCCSRPLVASGGHHAPRVHRVVAARYVGGREQETARAVERFQVSNGMDGVSDDFTSFADSCRFVNDLSHSQHHLFVAAHVERGVELAAAATAVCPDEAAAFGVMETWAGAVPLLVVYRVAINAAGLVDKLWARRPLFPDELHLLRDADLHVRRLARLPALELREQHNDECARANMLAAIDLYNAAMNTAGSEEARGHLSSVTARDFVSWEATGLWGDAAEHSVDATEAFMEATRGLADARGPGKFRSVLRSHAASASHNVAFAHFDFTGSARQGAPFATDALVVFVFNEDGTRMRQAMTLRGPLSIAEYTTVFRVPADIENT